MRISQFFVLLSLTLCLGSSAFATTGEEENDLPATVPQGVPYSGLDTEGQDFTDVDRSYIHSWQDLDAYVEELKLVTNQWDRVGGEGTWLEDPYYLQKGARGTRSVVGFSWRILSPYVFSAGVEKVGRFACDVGVPWVWNGTSWLSSQYLGPYFGVVDRTLIRSVGQPIRDECVRLVDQGAPQLGRCVVPLYNVAADHLTPKEKLPQDELDEGSFVLLPTEAGVDEDSGDFGLDDFFMVEPPDLEGGEAILRYVQEVEGIKELWDKVGGPDTVYPSASGYWRQRAYRTGGSLCHLAKTGIECFFLPLPIRIGKDVVCEAIPWVTNRYTGSPSS